MARAILLLAIGDGREAQHAGSIRFIARELKTELEEACSQPPREAKDSGIKSIDERMSTLRGEVFTITEWVQVHTVFMMYNPAVPILTGTSHISAYCCDVFFTFRRMRIAIVLAYVANDLLFLTFLSESLPSPLFCLEYPGICVT